MIGNDYATNKKEAEKLASALMSMGAFYHVTRSSAFVADSTLYRLTVYLTFSNILKDTKVRDAPSKIIVGNKKRLIVIGGGAAGSTISKSN